MGTISGGTGDLISGAQTNAVIVNSPQAFEETLQSQQESENALTANNLLTTGTAHIRHLQSSHQLAGSNRNEACSHLQQVSILV